MAHLVKLEDYVSRYQYDMYRYPSQFSRLKRERWKRLKREWEESYLNEEPSFQDYVEQQKKSFFSAFSKIKKWYKRDQVEEDDEYEQFAESSYQFKYKNLADVKTIFLKELFQFQLKWARSTLLEKSTMEQKYYYDETLKWYLQSFPDNYFLLYYPVVKLTKAAVEFDILLIGPTDIWCIVMLDGQENSIFQAHSERYWIETHGDRERKIINPFLSINRMSTIMKQILVETEIDLSLRKAIVTREGFIDIELPWSKTVLIDQRNISLWEQKLKNISTPIKSVQLKFTQKLLDVCMTTSMQRHNTDNEPANDEMNLFEISDGDIYNKEND